jgi:multidrug efflux pump subunit AcrA (membrane-fusion protein)
LAEAQSKVTEVTSKINALQTEINSIPTQEAIVNQKRDLYTTAQKQYDDTQATLNSQVASAQSQLESAKVQTSVSTLSTEEQLNAYKKQLAETNLTSTVSGTVTAVKVKAGDYYTGGALITIEGIESFIVEAEIDEYDIADIEVGMEAIIKTDSTRDEELSGTVISVAPTATSTASDLTTSVASSATYTVKISIDTENDRLRLGMNSKINIITEKSTDALTVPYTAVTENADGKSIVTVLNDDGSEEEIEVTVGLESGYYTEISSDKIKEGMKVKIPTVDGTSSLSELLESMGATAGI